MTTLERFGLTSNPFRELGNATPQELIIGHVPLGIDTILESICEEVFAKESRAVLALTGGTGSGKSERLELLATQARARSALAVSWGVLESNDANVRGLAEAFAQAAKVRKIGGFLGAPSWLRAVTAYAGRSRSRGDPSQFGRTVGEALNAASPSALLLNDLHLVGQNQDGVAFLEALSSLFDTVRAGVLVVFSSSPEYHAWLSQRDPTLASRVNRVLTIPPFSDAEAELLLAKRMLSRRIIEDLPPAYPFEREAIVLLNRGARGNPRTLLALADVALEAALARRAYRVDEEVATEALEQHDRPNSGRSSPSPAAWVEGPSGGPGRSRQPAGSP